MGFDAGSLAMVGGAAGGAASLGNGIAQYGAQNAQGRIASRMGAIQASWDAIRAQDALQRGSVEAGRAAIATRQLQGAQRVAAAVQNADVGTGTAATLTSQTSTLGAMDRLTIENNAFLEALGYRNQASNDLFAGKYARLAGRARGNSSLLQGAMGAVKDVSLGSALYGKFRVPEAAPKFNPNLSSQYEETAY